LAGGKRRGRGVTGRDLADDQQRRIRQGKVAKTTTWYAAPFEAPEWRAPFVESFPPLGT